MSNLCLFFQITDENDKENTIKEVDSMVCCFVLISFSVLEKYLYYCYYFFIQDERSHEKLMSDNNAMNNIDSNAPDFLDAFFKMDNIPGLLTVNTYYKVNTIILKTQTLLWSF